MSEEKSPKKNIKWGRYVLLALFGYLVYHWSVGPSGIINQRKLFKENSILENQIDSLHRIKTSLELQKKRLETDSSYLIQVIRQELGMSYPNEKVYKFMEK